MAFDYDKIKKKEEGGSQWTSYSDLFMVLSVVFLLLYVVSSLRNGTYGIQKYVEFKNIQKENEDLKQQLEVYNTLKDDYLEKKATEKEMQTYSELMDQLKLLKDDAKEEKEQLRLQAFENEKKEKALNKYQQVVRNIINSNVLAQERIKVRDTKIVERDIEITEQKQEIAEQNQEIEQQSQEIEKQKAEIERKKSIIAQKKKIIAENKIVLEKKQKEIKYLSKTVQEKKTIIAQNDHEIRSINDALTQKLNELNYAYKKQKMTKNKYEQQLAFVKKDSQKKISELKEHTQNVKEELGNTNEQLKLASNQLNKTTQKLQQQNFENKKLAEDITNLDHQYKKQIASLDSEYQSKLAGLRQQREADIANFEKERQMSQERFEKIRAMDKAGFAKLRSQDQDAFNKQLAMEQKRRNQEKGEYFSALNEEKERANSIKNQFAQALNKEKGRYMASINNLKNEKNALSEDLNKAQKLVSARKTIIGAIKDNFNRAGLPVDLDPKTGDVILSFQDEYFDTDRAELKPTMKNILHKFFPVYSKSLLSDHQIANMIASIEVVGFASPTYKGKYIDPKSLAKDDQAAVDYNMQLSFQRANSIFKYIFDTDKMQYPYQQTMRPIVKVTGRSFLADGIENRNIASSITNRDYCTKYNCKKSQKVIIRFNLKD